MNKKYIYDVVQSTETAPPKILRFVGTNKSVLEIGCASGSQSKVMKEQLGCSVTGVEIDPSAAEDARKFCDRVIIGDIGAIDLNEHLAGKRFDVIMFADVLEHLYDPCLVLERIKPWLSPDGYVLASIPNIAHASVVLALVKGNFDYKEYGLLDDTHIRFFTKQTIYQLFEKAGFVISNLDRVIASSVDTEFHELHIGYDDRVLLEQIQRSNPESETFQFIVKAYRSNERSALFLARERINELQQTLSEKDALTRQLEQALSDKDQQIRRLESRLEWITDKTSYKLLKRLRRFTGRD